MGEAQRSFKDSRDDLLRQLTATLTVFRRNRAALNRHQAARALHLIEFGNLVAKASLVELAGYDRATGKSSATNECDILITDHVGTPDLAFEIGFLGDHHQRTI